MREQTFKLEKSSIISSRILGILFVAFTIAVIEISIVAAFRLTLDLYFIISMILLIVDISLFSMTWIMARKAGSRTFEYLNAMINP